MSNDPALGARRIDVSDVVHRVFDTYAKTAKVLVLGALLVFLPVALLSALLGDSVAAIIAGLVSLVASVWYSGMVVKTVQDVQDGRVDASIGDLLASVAPALLPLFLVGLVAGLGITLGFVLLVVPGLVLLTIWSVAAPVVVVERPGVLAALRRSRELVAGNFWQVFGVIATIFVILLVVGLLFGAISAIADSFVLSFLVELAVNVLLAPVYALAAAVLYFALREVHGTPAGADAPSSAPDAFGRPTGATGLESPEAPGSAWRPPSAGDPSA